MIKLELAVISRINEYKSLREASRKLGISAAYLSRLIRGVKTNPSNETLAKLGIEKVDRYRLKDQK